MLFLFLDGYITVGYLTSKQGREEFKVLMKCVLETLRKRFSIISWITFKQTRNYGALRAPPLLAPAPRGHCRCHVYNGPCTKKKFGFGRPLKALRLLEGPWGGQRPSGTTRDQCCGQKEPFEPKKISASAGL